MAPLREVLTEILEGRPDKTPAFWRGTPTWSQAVGTLHAILEELPTYPPEMLPTVQEAAMQLVRGTSQLIPTEHQELPGPKASQAWWTTDRHHGMGDGARWRPPSPRRPGVRRQHSSFLKNMAPLTATVDDDCGRPTSTSAGDDTDDGQRGGLHDSPHRDVRGQK